MTRRPIALVLGLAVVLGAAGFSVLALAGGDGGDEFTPVTVPAAATEVDRLGTDAATYRVFSHRDCAYLETAVTGLGTRVDERCGHGWPRLVPPQAEACYYRNDVHVDRTATAIGGRADLDLAESIAPPPCDAQLRETVVWGIVDRPTEWLCVTDDRKSPTARFVRVQDGGTVLARIGDRASDDHDGAILPYTVDGRPVGMPDFPTEYPTSSIAACAAAAPWDAPPPAPTTHEVLLRATAPLADADDFHVVALSTEHGSLSAFATTVPQPGKWAVSHVALYDDTTELRVTLLDEGVQPNRVLDETTLRVPPPAERAGKQLVLVLGPRVADGVADADLVAQ